MGSYKLGWTIDESDFFCVSACAPAFADSLIVSIQDGEIILVLMFRSLPDLSNYVEEINWNGS